jgi:hypothetical protein
MTDQPQPAGPPPGAEPPAPEPSPGPGWSEPGLPAVEPAENGAPAQAVAREATVSSGAAEGSATPGAVGQSRLRWLVALGGIAVLVGVTVAILAITGAGRPAPSIAVGYMPNGTVQYSEYRLDLPGDQRQKLAAYLSKFPGFADQAAVQPKLYEVFDRIVGAASQQTQTFTADIEPWFGGQIAFGSGPVDASSLGNGQMNPSMSGFGNALFVVTITDPTKAAAWVQKTLDNKATASSYGGATLYTANGMVAALTDKVLLAGTDATVRAAIDSKGQGALASNPEFKAALSAVSHDYVAFTFINYRSLVSGIIDATAPAGGLQRSVDDALVGLIPEWLSSEVRFENDAIVAEGAYPAIDIGFQAKNRASGLAGHAPPSSVFYGESHDVGAALKGFLDKLRAIPELKSTFGQIDQSAGLIGGFDGLFGWWGDTAIAVGPDASGAISGGLLIAPTDAAAARKTFETLRSFVVLGGSQAGIQLRDETHGDATVTIIDFSAALAAAGGVPPGVKAEIAYTVTDDVVVIGYGKAFVEAVLDAGPGPSLADDARFKSLLARVGAENIGVSFVDIQAIRGLVEPLVKNVVPAAEWDTYQKEVVPYLSHLDALVSGARVDGGLNRLPMSFTVK